MTIGKREIQNLFNEENKGYIFSTRKEKRKAFLNFSRLFKSGKIQKDILKRKKKEVRKREKYLNSLVNATSGSLESPQNIPKLKDLKEKIKIVLNSPILLKKIFRTNEVLNIHDRNVIISKNMIGKKVHVYNGINLIVLNINEKMIGLKLGEFAFTKYFPFKNIHTRSRINFSIKKTKKMIIRERRHSLWGKQQRDIERKKIRILFEERIKEDKKNGEFNKFGKYTSG